ncbi:PREDICTED: probable polygalacturonase At3g15720 [Nicotiana attenuata]|uniref:endo-polygalacturonase n=1 Tax=Nicotiana attenuata TaxID=49451 RepID=A0A1J6IK20_NICAT|nr:PREDICTED: probable polygalacturonase At3g15720 [Nicotiana attenuata]OIT05066.1 putative polygalacturonase [Nicotiana attenuata]
MVLVLAATTMVYLGIFLVLLCMVSPVWSADDIKTFNVVNFGAVGDGKTDDLPAFLKAWEAVCQSESSRVILVIPERKKFLLTPSTFEGPCKPSFIHIQVSGNIIAPSSKSGWDGRATNAWLIFENIDHLTVNGNGVFDGQGHVWWSNPCLDDNNPSQETQCKGPTALIFRRCDWLRVWGVTLIRSARSHIILTACNEVSIANIRIMSPGDSPNTDGIDVSASTNVRLHNSLIATGDDCIAIGGGSSNVNISGITCGPGHGISIGSLGEGGFEIVEDVLIRNCTIKETLTGVRIKTWQGGEGYARRITFEGIKLVAVNNPIIIDQFYCPSRVNCKNDTAAVALSDITFRGISGTSLMDEVINLSCSETVGCKNILLDRVYISSVKGNPVHAKCISAHGRHTHTRPVVSCLLP